MSSSRWSPSIDATGGSADDSRARIAAAARGPAPGWRRRALPPRASARAPRRRRKEASSKRVPPRICKTSGQKRPIGQVDLESKWIRLALGALFRAEPFRVGAADREIRLEQGGAGEHGRRHRDEVLLHDAIRDRQLCAVFLHERGALVVGAPKSTVAGRRD